MENKNFTNPQDIQIQGLLDRYLRSQISNGNLAQEPAHLDEDFLTAFTEGKLTEREAQPIVRHLVDCSFCRHVTAELIKLDFALANTENADAVVSDAAPSKVSEVLNNLLSRIFGSGGDGAVFAHHETPDDTEKTENSENNKQ